MKSHTISEFIVVCFLMTGDNCCINGCGSNRKDKTLGFFKLPSTKFAHHREWREKWLAILLKYRQDPEFKGLVKREKVRTCSKHYHPHEIIHCKYFLNLIFPSSPLLFSHILPCHKYLGCSLTCLAYLPA